MNINYLLFWGCSFVFFFVPSIISSSAFQRLVKRSGEEKPMSVPLGCSLFVGIEGENKDDGRFNSKSKRKRKSPVLVAVSCALVLTYKGFYPPKMMLPGMPQSLRPYFLSRLYEHLSAMTAKPFNSYTMYSSHSFPTQRTVAFLVLKKRSHRRPPPNKNQLSPSKG